MRTARDLVRGTASRLGIDDAALADVVLATSEAVTNAIEHGSPCPRGRIRLRVCTTPALVVEVSDCGGFWERGEEPDPRGTRGRGLFIVEAVMDEVELLPSDSGTTLRMVKHHGAPDARRGAARTVQMAAAG